MTEAVRPKEQKTLEECCSWGWRDDLRCLSVVKMREGGHVETAWRVRTVFAWAGIVLWGVMFVNCGHMWSCLEV